MDAWQPRNVCRISIHALLAESDQIWSTVLEEMTIFLSTLSLRRATPSTLRHCTTYLFLSTLSLRRATVVMTEEDMILDISIHALLAESDERANRLAHAPPKISIHALLAESDSKSAQNSGALLRIWNKFYGDCIFILTGKAVFYPFCPCFFHIFWCEGTGNFMIAFPSH